MINGRVWKFGDGVDTDVMFPGRAMKLTTEEAATLLFDAVRPGWPELVRPGDIMVAGKNFGMGSARPVGVLLVRIGIAAVLADSLSSLFQRNCINAGLLAVTAPGVSGIVNEGDIIAVDEVAGLVEATASGRSCTFAPLPEFMQGIIAGGGILGQLRREGYLPPPG